MDNIKALQQLTIGRKLFQQIGAHETPKCFSFDDYIYQDTADSFAKFLQRNNGQDIILYINSRGGEVVSLACILDLMQRYQGKITARVTGIAASAAAEILLHCSRVEVSEFAQLLFHNTHVYIYGDAEKLRNEADYLEKIDQPFRAKLAEKTGLSIETLQSEYLTPEKWITAKEAIDMHIADAYIDYAEITAFDEVEVVNDDVISIDDDIIASFNL